MRLKLMVKGGNSQNGSGKIFVVTNTSYVTLGRKHCHLNLSDAYCSKQHAILFEGRDGSLIVQDLLSRNGTFVGEERVHVSKFQPGDQLTLGRTELVVLNYTPSRKARACTGSFSRNGTGLK